jgi:hypothetical protein
MLSKLYPTTHLYWWFNVMFFIFNIVVWRLNQLRERRFKTLTEALAERIQKSAGFSEAMRQTLADFNENLARKNKEG